MRITILQGAFLPVPPIMGGAVEKVWYSLAREFAVQGHQVVHISRRHPELPNQEVSGGVKYIRVPGYSATNQTALLKWRDFRYTFRALRHLPEADILVTNTFWAPLLTNRKNKAGLCYVHVARYPKGQMKFYRRAARLQTVSTSVAKAIATEIHPMDRRVVVIPNPVCIPDLARTNETYQTGPIKLLYTGRIHPEKGIHLVLEALGLLPENIAAQLCFDCYGPWKTAGGGGGRAYRDSLVNRAGTLPSTINLHEPIYDRKLLDTVYQSADLFLYPSLAEKGETFGLAILEAMANGTPPLVSNLECFTDFVKHGENGMKFNHRQSHPAKALADTLETVIGNREKLAHYARNARTTAEDYTEEKIARQYLEDFESLLAAHG